MDNTIKGFSVSTSVFKLHHFKDMKSHWGPQQCPMHLMLVFPRTFLSYLLMIVNGLNNDDLLGELCMFSSIAAFTNWQWQGCRWTGELAVGIITAEPSVSWDAGIVAGGCLCLLSVALQCSSPLGHFPVSSMASPLLDHLSPDVLI